MTHDNLPATAPSSDQLILACRGLLLDPSRHPLLNAAGQLAELHRDRLAVRAVHGIDRHRVRLVRAIDSYVRAHTPRPLGHACAYPETIGAVVDRLAGCCTVAYATHPMISETERRCTEPVAMDLAREVAELLPAVLSGERVVPVLYVAPRSATGIMATRCGQC